MRAALVVHELVDLVDDDGLDVREDLSRVGREEQVERLGRRDEDVGRMLGHARALAGGRVASADADGDLRRARDAGERRPQVALDVDRKRLERRDVKYTRRFLRGRSPPGEPVDRPQKRGERLARAGRREDQRRLASSDRRPAERLSSRGRAERRSEVGPRLGREERERVHDERLATGGRFRERLWRSGANHPRSTIPALAAAKATSMQSAAPSAWARSARRPASTSPWTTLTVSVTSR